MWLRVPAVRVPEPRPVDAFSSLAPGGIVAFTVPTEGQAVSDPTDGREIPFERWWNVRDLGGLPLEGGGTTRHGVLVRGATPGYATPGDVDRARRLGLTSFVDLRMPGQAPDWRDGTPEINRVGVDLVGGLSRPRDGSAEQLLRFLLDAGRAEIARAVRTITLLAMQSPPVVFHCHTGKDRTGVVAIVMLALAGVPEGSIVDDYLASNPGFEAMRDALAADSGTGFMAGAPPAFKGPVSRPAAEEALRFLADAGGAGMYLVSAGLAPPEIERAAGLLR
jgi:hypothetical protein